MGNKLYMIEGGRPLEMVKAHIAEIKRVREDVRQLSLELGIERGSTDLLDGRLCGVVFKGEVHPDFKRTAIRGAHYPKKGTEWSKKLAAQVGYPNPETLISREFGVPLCVEYRTESGEGTTSIGNILRACGFLYLGEDGPYALWIPDVWAEVAVLEAAGCTVEEGVKAFKFDVPGLTPMEPEEWEILVLQHQLKEKKAKV